MLLLADDIAVLNLATSQHEDCKDCYHYLRLLKSGLACILRKASCDCENLLPHLQLCPSQANKGSGGWNSGYTDLKRGILLSSQNSIGAQASYIHF